MITIFISGAPCLYRTICLFIDRCKFVIDNATTNACNLF